MKNATKSDYKEVIPKIFRKIIMKIIRLGLWELLEDLIF